MGGGGFVWGTIFWGGKGVNQKRWVSFLVRLGGVFKRGGERNSLSLHFENVDHHHTFFRFSGEKVVRGGGDEGTGQL